MISYGSKNGHQKETFLKNKKKHWNTCSSSIVNIFEEETIWPLNELKNLHFDIELDIHMSELPCHLWQLKAIRKQCEQSTRVHCAHIKWPTCDGWWLIGKILRRDSWPISYDIDKNQSNPLISIDDVTKWIIVTLKTINVHTGGSYEFCTLCHK